MLHKNNNINRAFLICVLFSFLFIWVMPINCMQQVLTAPINLLRSNIKNLDELSYLKSTKHLIVLPNNQELEIDWGFNGSGSLLESFPKMKLRLKPASAQVIQEPQENQKFSLKELLKIIAQSKLSEKLESSWNILQQYFPNLDWLLQEQNSSIKIFAVKLFILLKDKTLDGQNLRKKIEILRLLFRLNLSTTFSESFDKNKKLSDYLPDNFKYLFSDNNDLIKFIDDTWLKVINVFTESNNILDNADKQLDKKFDFMQTYKLLFIALVKNFNEYKIAKFNNIDNADASNDIQKKELSEQEQILLESLKIAKDKLSEKFNLINARVAELETKLSKLNISTDAIDKDIYFYLNEDFKKINAEKIEYEKQIKEIQYKIDELEYGVEIRPEDVNFSSNLNSMPFMVLINILLKSPEFREMAADFNNNNVYSSIKETLNKQIEFIFKNSDHVKKNLKIYKYIIKTLFPNMQSAVENIAADLSEKDEKELNTQELAAAVLGL
ncbi:hypothetical protein K9L05_02825 [Candidatus Babeliales bacterium]|nr:hypothetical protein [Candidatus Babeliales bacterium]MCF7899559.1 hypothetical protein [Candidatus Babeliales bacterium]